MFPATAFECPRVEPELITSDRAPVILRMLKSPVARVTLRIAQEIGSAAAAVAPARVLTLQVRALDATVKASDRFWIAPGLAVGSPISARAARRLVIAVFS